MQIDVPEKLQKRIERVIEENGTPPDTPGGTVEGWALSVLYAVADSRARGSLTISVGIPHELVMRVADPRRISRPKARRIISQHLRSSVYSIVQSFVEEWVGKLERGEVAMPEFEGQ